MFSGRERKPDAACNVCNSFIMMIIVARLRIINIDKANTADGGEAEGEAAITLREK